METHYRNIKRLGKGATAEVFLVEEVETGQYYAMKVGAKGERLKWEAKLLETLNSDFFPKVKEYSEECGEYLVMEYIEGINLQELLDQEGSPETGEIRYIMEGILKALDHLHKHRPAIIYRDLKPANVMLEKDGRICLIDLGAACYEDGKEKTVQAGTYGYAAPEQFWKGIIPGITCDIYAAGKVFAYLLSGKNPAEPPYDVEEFCRGLKQISDECMQVLERSLVAEPQARYTDCESMYRDICRALTEKTNKKRWKTIKKRRCSYKKCIWKSEYRRIF